MNINLSNILAIYAKVMDCLTFSKIAFQNRVTWIPEEDFNDPEDVKKVNVGEGGLPLPHIYTFYIAFGMAIVYAILSSAAIEHARNDTLGVDESGNLAGFPHK